MYDPQTPRARAGASALAIVGLIGAMMVAGLGVPRAEDRTLALVAVNLTQPKPTPTAIMAPPPPSERPAAKREASPRNLSNQATPIVAPHVQPLIVPPPVVAAPDAGLGAAANTGASNLPGPGRGAGGIGNGDGGGGMGGEGDGVAVVGPVRVRGDLGYRDLPKGVLQFGQRAAVRVLYTVNADGTVSQCEADRSSGYGEIDVMACRLIQQRFRFRPARDRLGRAVRAKVIETHTWVEDGR